MGIPAFFRWLSKKYPSIVVPADKDFDHGYSFDNLYLDMNGHPENKPPPETEEDMFEAIFEYIDMLLDMVKPCKVLYMAIDGVAPRAKMNQQRSRRFRAAKESIEKKQFIEGIKNELRMKGVEFDESIKQSHFDSNVITPGTPFMTNLGKALRDWIDHKLANAADGYCKDERNKELKWPKDLIVILSDASVPGEGEHKIIDFIRKQKAHPDYNPNLRHCLNGADADLIMLGLATHELDFTILREEFVPNQPKACDICAQYGHETKECQGKASVPDVNTIKCMSTSFIYIRLCVLREYLEKECDDLDFERYVDDFVLLCFFVGNDFLPHLPSLEIRENAIDKLLRIYKECMSQYSHPKPYITDNGFVSLHKVQMILREFGKMEDDIFVRRKINDERYKMRLRKQKMLDHKALNSAWMAPVPVVERGQAPERLSNVKEEAVNLSKETLEKDESGQLDTSSRSTSPIKQTKRKIDESLTEDSSIDKELDTSASDLDEDDDVQLWNSGWKERYYLHKFDCKDYHKVSDVVVKEYVVGLCWVMRYYYQGCADWQWYYPFHYAPFASDFKDVENVKVQFDRDAKPFKPLEQLMSVFPAASCSSLPPSWQVLMKSSDSNIIDFYPKNFKIDLNGKKQAWQGVALLPFIDENRLFNTLKKVYPDLTPSEMDRNQLGENLIFISKSNENLMNILSNALKSVDDSTQFDCYPEQMQDIKGKLRKSKRYTDQVLNSFCLEYFDPVYAKDFVFPAKRPPEAVLPERILKPEDFKNNYRGGGGYQQNYRGQNRDNYSNNSNFNNNQHRNNSNNGQYYRPVIGFTRHNQQQASLSNAGHRTLDFHTRQNYNNSGNFQNHSRPNAYQQANNFQPTYQTANYQAPRVALPPVVVPHVAYQQQPYYQLNYPSQQTAYQPNYANPLNSYARRDNLNPFAQDFIPSYDQVPSQLANPNSNNNNNNNNNNRRPANNRN